MNMIMGIYHNFQQYFSYIMAVSIIGEGDRSTQRKPHTCSKSLTNLMMTLYLVNLDTEMSVIFITLTGLWY